MARSKGSRKATRHQPQPETPVRDRSRQIIASCDGSAECIGTAQPAPSPTSSVNKTDHASSASTISTSSSPAPLSKKAKRRARARNGTRSESQHSISVDESKKSTVDNSGCPRPDDISEIVTPQPVESRWCSSFPPTKDLQDRMHSTHSAAPEKRDSVFSVNWEDAKVQHDEQTLTMRRSYFQTWRRTIRPSSWWPCRLFRWVKLLIVTIIQGFRGTRRLDFILTSILLFVCLFVICTTLDFVLTGLVKGVTAQETIEAANCSVIYVTIPGPIITVSLIAASPTDPARGTYYYSVVDGTTEWLNSVAPPSRSIDSVTHISLLTSTTSPSKTIRSNTMKSDQPVPASSTPTVSSTTIATTFEDGLTASTMSLSPSTESMTPVSPSLSSSPPSLSMTGSTVLDSTSGPPLFPSLSDTLSMISSSWGIKTIPSSTTIISASQSDQRTSAISGTIGSQERISSPSLTAGLSSSLETGTAVSGIVTSTLVVATSIISDGVTTVITYTTTTLLVVSSRDTLTNSDLSRVSSKTLSSTTFFSESRSFGRGSSGTSSNHVSLTASSAKILSSGSIVSSSLTSDIAGEPKSSVTLVPTSSSGFEASVSSPIGVPTQSVAISTSTLLAGQSTSLFDTSMGSSKPASTSPSTIPWSVSYSSVASSASTISSREFTVSLPRPTSGVSTTRSATKSWSTTIEATISTATQVSSSISPSISRSPSGVSVTSSGGNNISSASLSASNSIPVTASSQLPSSISQASSTSMTSGPSRISTVSSVSLTNIFPSTLSRGTMSLTGSTAGVSSQTLLSSVATSSPVPSSTISTADLSTLSSSLSTTSVLSSTLASENSAVSTSSSAMSSALTPITPTAAASIPSDPQISTLSSGVPSASSITLSDSMETSVFNTPTLTTTLSAPGVSSSSSITPSNPSSTEATDTTSMSLTTSQPASSSGFETSQSATSGSLLSSITGSTPVRPGSFSSIFPNSTSTNTSSTAPMTTMSSSTFSESDSPASNSFALSISGSSSVGLTPPAELPSNSSGNVTSSISSSTLPSTVTVTTTTASLLTSDSNSTSMLQARNLMTKVISYGDTSIVFVFPTPSIVTTQSYWTGTYPTVTGPEPSDLQTIPLTTRSIRQTALSELPSFELFTSSRGFKTVVDTVARAAAIATRAVQPWAAEPTECGESGNFTLSFDDTTVGPNDNDVVVVNGMKNPYHHLFYANGFANVPDKWEPYPAISQPNVAMFLPLSGRLLPNSPFAGTLLPGEMGAGPRASVTAYWFNAYSGYFGCALSGLTPCLLRISGYRYDRVLKQEVVVAEQNVTLPACWLYVNCRLTQVVFSEDFRGLSGIQFNAFTSGLGIPQAHMMDEVQLGWYNNSCSAGIWRIGHL